MTSEHKLSLPLKTTEAADAPADEIRRQARAQLGFVPNMYAAMANSPGLLDTYKHGYDHFRQRSGFSYAEQEAVLLTISRFHECDYCMAAQRAAHTRHAAGDYREDHQQLSKPAHILPE